MSNKSNLLTLKFPLDGAPPKKASVITAFDAAAGFARVEVTQKQETHNIYIIGAGPAFTAPCDSAQTWQVLDGKLEVKRGAQKKTVAAGGSITLEFGETYTFRALEGPVIVNAGISGGQGAPGNQSPPIIR